MKNTTSLLSVITLIIFSLNGFGQETIWFNSNWQPTTESQGKYYRPYPKKIDQGYWIVNYYMNGQVQMEGYSSILTPGKEEFEGLVLYYHENGTPFHKANYKNGQLHGIRKVYYETGELKEQGRYVEGKRSGIWKTFYKNGKIKEKGKYKDNEKSGIWKTFHKNTKQ